jgi:hypothetical protein
MAFEQHEIDFVEFLAFLSAVRHPIFSVSHGSSSPLPINFDYVVY